MNQADSNSDSNIIDYNNYKGITKEIKESHRWHDEITGAHFNYYDMYQLLIKLQKECDNTSFEDKNDDKVNIKESKNVFPMKLITEHKNKGLPGKSIKLLLGNKNINEARSISVDKANMNTIRRNIEQTNSKNEKKYTKNM